MITVMRRLRHGPLRFLGPIWVCLGAVFRYLVKHTKLLTRQTIGGFGPFLLDSKFAFSDFEHWGGAHNGGFNACIEACRGKQCVIDIGAHIGLVTLPAASVMDSNGILVAFEPATANRHLLRRHLEVNELNARVQVESQLVGSEDSIDVEFFELAEHTGMNSTVPRALDGRYKSVSRKQTTLDTYCALNNFIPEVIKIDVEGAELAVLDGGRQIITEHRPTIFLSVHPRQIKLLGQTTEMLVELIHSLGYDCRHVDGSPVNTFALEEYILTPRKSS